MKVQQKKEGKYIRVLEALMEIIEDKPNFQLPRFFYCILIILYLVQVLGYVISTHENKPIIDPKMRFVSHIYEVINTGQTRIRRARANPIGRPTRSRLLGAHHSPTAARSYLESRARSPKGTRNAFAPPPKCIVI